jgi:hypothetical protein
MALILAALGALVNAVLLLRFELANPIFLGWDASRTFYWTVTLWDPELFPNCLFTDFYRFFYQSIGVKSAYALIAHFTNPIHVYMYIMIVMYTLSSCLVFKIAKHISGNRTAVIALLLFLLKDDYMWYFFRDGMPRSFVFPSLLLFVYALQKWDLKWIYLSFVGIAFFGPVVFPVSYLLFAFFIIEPFLRAPKLRLAITTLLKLSIPVLPILLAITYRHMTTKHFYGPILNQTNFYLHPEFIAVVPEFLDPLKSLWVQMSDTLPLPLITGLLSVLLGIGWAIHDRHNSARWNKIVLALMMIPISLFALGSAYVFMFHFYCPSRQVMYSLPLAFILLGAYGAGRCLDQLKSQRWIVPSMLGMFIVFRACSLLIPENISTNARLPMPSALIAYIRALPKDALIAADPRLAGYIPMYLYRKVFYDPNSLDATFFPQYENVVRQREKELCDALYSGNLNQLRDLKKTYGVSCLIFDRTALYPFRSFPELFYSNDRTRDNFSKSKTTEWFETLTTQGKSIQFNNYTVVELS